jgi:cbb3-type cytochrome oxidase cytochrome c subunit
MRKRIALLMIGASGAALAAAGLQTRADPVQGQKVFIAQKCNICHVIDGVGGRLGPDLSDIGKKRTAAWFEKYLPDPRAVNPKGKMPAQPIKGQDLKDLSAYLATLKGKK